MEVVVEHVVGVVGARLGDAAPGGDLGEDGVKESEAIEEAEAGAGVGEGEDPSELVADALGSGAGDGRGAGGDLVRGGGVDVEMELGGDTGTAKEAEGVGVEDGGGGHTEAAGGDVVEAAGDVDGGGAADGDGEGVDGEVAAAEVVVEGALQLGDIDVADGAGVEDDAGDGVVAVELDEVAVEGGGEVTGKGEGIAVDGNVEVVDGAAEERVAHRAADGEGGDAGFIGERVDAGEERGDRGGEADIGHGDSMGVGGAGVPPAATVCEDVCVRGLGGHEQRMARDRCEDLFVRAGRQPLHGCRAGHRLRAVCGGGCDPGGGVGLAGGDFGGDGVVVVDGGADGDEFAAGGDVVDVEDAVDVVDLVLEGLGEEGVDGGLDAEVAAVAVDGLGGDVAGAGDLGLVAGHGEAALHDEAFARVLDDLGVDEGEEAVVVRLDDDDAEGDADLGSGEADAGGGAHGLDHLVDELVDGGIDAADAMGFLAEDGVGGDVDRQDAHGVRVSNGGREREGWSCAGGGGVCAPLSDAGEGRSTPPGRVGCQR